MRQYFLSERTEGGTEWSVLESEGTVSDVNITDFYGAREIGRCEEWTKNSHLIKKKKVHAGGEIVSFPVWARD